MSRHRSPHNTVLDIDWSTQPPTVTACSPVSLPDPAPVQMPGLTPNGLRAWLSGELIQDAMPDVSADHREMLMSGITPEQWRKLFPPQE